MRNVKSNHITLLFTVCLFKEEEEEEEEEEETDQKQ